MVAINEKSIGNSYPFDEIEYIDTSSVTQNRYDQPQTLKVNEAPSRAKRILKNGDTIISTVRPIQRHFGFIKNMKPNAIASTGFAVLSPKKIHPEFLYYYLSQDSITFYLNGIAETSTTTFPAFRPDVLTEMEVQIPESTEIQCRIASVLSSIDDKIEMNRLTNKTLETIAQTLFREMCVPKRDELPKDWRLAKLGEYIEVKNGYAFKGGDFISDGVPVIKIKNVKAGVVNLNNLSFVSREVADKARRFRINKDDLLITMSGNRIDGTPETWVGKVGIFQKDGEYLLNQRVSILNVDQKRMSRYFLCQLLSTDEMQYYFISNATSSGGQGNISPDLINNTEIIVPPIEILKEYDVLIKSIYDKKFTNDLEIESLSEIRDSLLPKLMKGEIEIN